MALNEPIQIFIEMYIVVLRLVHGCRCIITMYGEMDVSVAKNNVTDIYILKEDCSCHKMYKLAPSSSVHCLINIWLSHLLEQVFLSILTKANTYMNIGSTVYFSYNTNVAVCKRSII